MIRRLSEALRTSVRARLLAIALLPLLFVLPGLLGLVLYWSNAYFDRLLVAKVTSDLVVADQYFQRVVERMGQDVSALAQSRVLMRRLAPDASLELASLLAWKRDELKLDFLRFHKAGESLLGEPLGGVLGQALAGWPNTALDVFSQSDLAGIDPGLARLARLELIPTPNAAPDPRREETRGLVIHSAVPVYNDEGALLGILEGGMLLNQNLSFVDTLNDLVYRPRAMFPGSHGTATLFLGDVRIATNVRLFEGQRALGTRVSRQVRDRVLGEGQTWQNRAFVVKDWYISGYQPLLDSHGDRVGMLYVGFLEAPFRHAKQAAVSAIVLLVLGVGVVGAAFFWRWARGIFRPLERMDATLSAVEAGDLMSRTGPVASRDEIGRLARHLDALLDTVAQRNRELARWAESLDRKVAERTAELTEANAQLIDTQRQLAISGKLAAIGELTAGVAHEINNPVAVMQGNLDLMRQLLGEAAAPVREEMRLLDEQLWRIQQIVSRLLQFARPQEFAGYTEAVDINILLEDCLILVRHQLGKHVISVEKRFEASRRVEINRGELQQVVINLLVNAIQSMPRGGMLTLGSVDDGEGGLFITVRDTGVGIAPENLERIFDPFFTTKRSEGTRIAQAAGGYVQADAQNQVLHVLPRYAIAPWDWPSATADIEIPADVATTEGIAWSDQPAYNAVYISGAAGGILGHVKRTGTAGDIVAQMITDDLTTHADAARQRGLAILSDTGRQADISLSMPILETGGIVLPGTLVDYVDGTTTRRGLARAISIDAAHPKVRQTIRIETHG